MIVHTESDGRISRCWRTSAGSIVVVIVGGEMTSTGGRGHYCRSGRGRRGGSRGVLDGWWVLTAHVTRHGAPP